MSLMRAPRSLVQVGAPPTNGAMHRDDREVVADLRWCCALEGLPQGEGAPAFMAHPWEHRPQPASTSTLMAFMNEITRRASVVNLFPNGAAILCLDRTPPTDRMCEWWGARRSMSNESAMVAGREDPTAVIGGTG
jgi:hypothetical protein